MTTSADCRVQPSWRFIFSHPAHFLSFGFGSGLFPRAPGTAGTLVAFPIYWVLAERLTDVQFILVLIWAFAVGCGCVKKPARHWVCQITAGWCGMKLSLSCWCCFLHPQVFFGNYWRFCCSDFLTSSSHRPSVTLTRHGMVVSASCSTTFSQRATRYWAWRW